MDASNWMLIAILPGLIGYPIVLGKHRRNGLAAIKSWTDPVFIGQALLFSVFWPVLGLLLLIERFVKKILQKSRATRNLKDQELARAINLNNLRFARVTGIGLFYCNECNYTQRLLGSVHGIGDPFWAKHSTQCQKCGRFHEVETYNGEVNVLPVCECGGILSDNERLFCPRCKSHNVAYVRQLIS